MCTTRNQIIMFVGAIRGPSHACGAQQRPMLVAPVSQSVKFASLAELDNAVNHNHKMPSDKLAYVQMEAG